MTIHGIVTHSGKKHRFTTGLTIAEKDWIKSKGKPRNVIRPNIQLIEECLSDTRRDILRIFLENKDMGRILSPKEVIDELRFKNTQNNDLPRTMSEVIQLRLKEMEQKVKAGKQKESTLRDFKAFQNFWTKFVDDSFSYEPGLNTFDQALVIRYIQYSIDNGDKPSTTNDKRLKWLKTAWKYASDNKLTENSGYHLAKREKYDVIRPVINATELQMLYELYCKLPQK